MVGFLDGDEDGRLTFGQYVSITCTLCCGTVDIHGID